jgi:hypothetical protein
MKGTQSRAKRERVLMRACQDLRRAVALKKLYWLDHFCKVDTHWLPVGKGRVRNEQGIELALSEFWRLPRRGEHEIDLMTGVQR